VANVTGFGVTTGTLFPLGSWAGDPLNPNRDTVTPGELVGSLTRPEREMRVRRLIAQAHEIADEAISLHLTKHTLTGVCLLWSGGNDSNILAHLMRPRITHVIHANTGIGIERTRQHVRDHAEAWGLPLIEHQPSEKDSYEQFVLTHGFPGPGQHPRMFQRLKERAFEAARNEFNPHPHAQRVMFLAGRRREESKRRGGNAATGTAPIPQIERKGSVVWAAPLSMWTKLDMNTYRLMYRDVPHNEVSDFLHMSGECLCGSYAAQGELDLIRFFFPTIADYLDDLGRRALANGVHPDKCVWGWGWNEVVKQRVNRRASLSSLCDSCNQLALIEREAS
jgi:3'-phosphoadenosine 5'-phosphosulfate sulfotransferase (PAPS reductase)/FAD synthetase